MRNNPVLRQVGRISIPILFYVGLLWLAAFLLNEPLQLPYPGTILKAWGELAVKKVFWISIAASLWHVFLGLAIGVLCGAVLGLLSHFFPALSILVRPLLTVVRSTPVAAIIMLVWRMSGPVYLPVVIAAMMVTPIIADQLTLGLDGADPLLAEMTSLFGFSRLRAFLTYRLPAALPYFFGAVLTSVGLAWKSGIAAEVISAASRSVGREIYFSRLYISEVDTLWAWTLTSIVLSLILEFVVKKTLLFVNKGRNT